MVLSISAIQEGPGAPRFPQGIPGVLGTTSLGNCIEDSRNSPWLVFCYFLYEGRALSPSLS